MHITSKFNAQGILANKHVQTLLPRLVKRKPVEHFQFQQLDLPDGDFVDLVWNGSPPDKSTESIVIIFHGLEGSIHSPYAREIMHSFAEKNQPAVLMHFRNCSGRPNRLPRSYHSGDTGDASFLIDWLSEQYPQAKLTAVGYSLGGNMLLKLLGEQGESVKLKAAVSVSAPILLDVCADTIQQGFSVVYQKYLVKSLIKNTRIKYQYHDYKKLFGIPLSQVEKSKTFWDFDDGFTAPVNGFASAEDYYSQSSARQYLKDIKIPTLIIHALDDPFMTKEIVPDHSELSVSTELELSKHGGHVGYVKRGWLKPEYWLNERIPEFILQFC